MKKSGHRIIGSLLLIFSFISVCAFFYLDVKQLNCKLVAAIHLVNKEELTTIKIPCSSFNPNQEEISLNGSLYDVNSYTIAGDTAIVSVWHDKDEEIVQRRMVCSFEANAQYQDKHQGPIQFTKYKPYIPDGKILNNPCPLTFINRYIAKHFPVICNTELAACQLADVIKPPPDKLS